jgi:hypothetical protein
LRVTSLMQPANHALGLGAQQSVALRVRDNGRQSQQL